MNRCNAPVALLFALAVGSGCAARGPRGSLAEADTSCTSRTWWIEAPAWLFVGEKSTIRIRRCEGVASPVAFSWSTSNWMVVRIVEADSERVTVRAQAPGRAAITATAREPGESAAVTILVQ